MDKEKKKQGDYKMRLLEIISNLEEVLLPSYKLPETRWTQYIKSIYDDEKSFDYHYSDMINLLKSTEEDFNINNLKYINELSVIDINDALFINDFFLFIPDLFWIFSILILLIFGLYFETIVKSLNLNRLIIELTLPVVFFSIFFFLLFKDINLLSLFSIKIDYFYVCFRLIFLFFFIFCLYSSKNIFIYDKMYIYEFSILLFLSAEGSFLMVMTDNLFIFYLALEMQNLCFYVLASLKRYSNFSTEAGLKYFLLGAFSSSILLFGISIIYGILGTLNLNEIQILLYYNNFENYSILLFISLFFIISGLLFKLGSAPFHYWVPDVYEGSPTIITMFFSIMPKIVLSFVLVKLYFFIFFFEIKYISFLFLICGIFSIIVGIYNAMFQIKIKRFLAYSAIANVGFILLGFSTMTFDGIFASLFYLFCYIFSISLIFFLLLNVRYYNGKEIYYLYDLSLLKNHPFLMYSIIIIFFSFAGIPPLIGFFGKFFLFMALLNSFNYLLLLFILILSVISSFYYLRVIRFLFFTKINDLNIFHNNLNNNYFFFSIILFFNIFFLFFFDFFGEYFYYFLIKSFYA